MGLTNSSVGRGAIDIGDITSKISGNEKIVALAGNPNVGKSTVFNGLTGMKQHTGNWAGKTVSTAVGRCGKGEKSFWLVDTPGTYSLISHSREEEVARDFICFGSPDVTVVVCDATCLERNLGLVLQISEASPCTVVCLNLLDEARRKGIKIDTEALSERLGLPVVGVVARKKRSLEELVDAIDKAAEKSTEGVKVRFCEALENALEKLSEALCDIDTKSIDARWISLRLLDGDASLLDSLADFLGFDILQNEELLSCIRAVKEHLCECGLSGDALKEAIAGGYMLLAEDICRGVVSCENEQKGYLRDVKIDKILTGKLFAYPVMLGFLALVFFITIWGANAISDIISSFLLYIGDIIGFLLKSVGTPALLQSILIDGVYRVLSWVISVMLPPMAIFFPLFTLLEDSGYLPRIAYNLDKPFSRCSSCGKQALTMCMGFGCNAAGVVGCRIIDSPRERLLAILTNSFVPCNGKFPMLIMLISIFLVSGASSMSSMWSAFILTALIVLAVLVTFGATWLLSKTLLRGVPSSFTIELPPYRRPQILRVLLRSVFDRTVFVLGRAVAVAAPAGAVIWIMANVCIGDVSLLRWVADALDPIGRFIGVDGVILVAFILGLPANEIIVPIIIMAYLAEGSIVEARSLDEIRGMLVSNGWDIVTAGSVIILSLLHSPCTTTLMTIRKETGSVRWTLLAAALPTTIGLIICAIFANLVRAFS